MDKVNVSEDGFLAELRSVNSERAKVWIGETKSDPLFWAVELGGEVGEILNVVKKLRREEFGWRGSRASLDDLADEIADGLICLDSLARHYGIDIAAATICKFNKTSEKVELPHRLAHRTTETARVAAERNALRLLSDAAIIIRHLLVMHQITACTTKGVSSRALLREIQALTSKGEG